MNLTVNGIVREVESGPLTPLLFVLRDELELTGAKAGCQQGGCGACTVLVDGEPRRSCLTPLAAVEGAEITTVEGLGTPEDLAPIAGHAPLRGAVVSYVRADAEAQAYIDHGARKTVTDQALVTPTARLREDRGRRRRRARGTSSTGPTRREAPA